MWEGVLIQIQMRMDEVGIIQCAWMGDGTHSMRMEGSDELDRSGRTLLHCAWMGSITHDACLFGTLPYLLVGVERILFLHQFSAALAL